MLYQPVKNLWQTEGFFSANSREIAMSHEDSKCLKSLIEETNLVRGKYQYPYYGKRERKSKPQKNFWTSSENPKTIAKEITEKSPEFYGKYKQTIDKYINEGYARKLNKDGREKVSSRTFAANISYLHRRRLQEVFSVTISLPPRHLEDVLQKYLEDDLRMD